MRKLGTTIAEVRAQWEGGHLPFSISLIPYLSVALKHNYFRYGMPSTAQRKRRRQDAFAERQLREEAEARNLLLEGRLKELTDRPPAPRPGISTRWDWRCSCGRLVYANKRSCDICGCTRVFAGTTVTGSIRGVQQNLQEVRTALVRQQRVPGMAPASYAAAVRAPVRAQSQQDRRTKQPAQASSQQLAAGQGAVHPTRNQAPTVASAEKQLPRDKQQEEPASAKQLLNAENEDLLEEADDDTMFV